MRNHGNGFFNGFGTHQAVETLGITLCPALDKGLVVDLGVEIEGGGEDVGGYTVVKLNHIVLRRRGLLKRNFFKLAAVHRLNTYSIALVDELIDWEALPHFPYIAGREKAVTHRIKKVLSNLNDKLFG